jgi:hypothetical protein
MKKTLPPLGLANLYRKAATPSGIIKLLSAPVELKAYKALRQRGATVFDNIQHHGTVYLWKLRSGSYFIIHPHLAEKLTGRDKFQRIAIDSKDISLANFTKLMNGPQGKNLMVDFVRRKEVAAVIVRYDALMELAAKRLIPYSEEELLEIIRKEAQDALHGHKRRAIFITPKKGKESDVEIKDAWGSQVIHYEQR